MMYFAGFPFVLSMIIVGNTLEDWKDLKVGDCIAVDQLQELSGVVEPEAYKLPTKCGDEYLAEDTYAQEFACGLEVDAGYWTKSVVSHDKAGVYIFSSPPCVNSIESLQLDYSEHSFYNESGACSEENLYRSFHQTETYRSKWFSAGGGELYLPYPFTVTSEWFEFIGEDPYRVCESTDVWLEYTGWGNLSARIQTLDCARGTQSFCREAKLSSSETANGNLCLKIKKLSACN